MQRLLFVRHGESRHAGDGLTGGWTDTDLTSRGLEQARVTAARLRSRAGSIEALYASDLNRARQTAAPIAEALGLAAIFDARLRELNNGVAAGLSEVEARKIELPMTTPTLDWKPYPEAESWGALYRRVAACLREIEHANNGTVVIIGHGNMGQCLIGAWLQLSATSRQRTAFAFANCSISEFCINRFGERQIERLNDVSHLVTP